jgi:hypothetical protein
MAAINTSQELAKVRSKIDAQQQVVSDLELLLQRTLLGESVGNVATVTGNVLGAYSGLPDGAVLDAAFKEGIKDFLRDTNSDHKPTAGETDTDQDLIRNMLYQARAMLGELRVEEQQWNTEVNEEKARRKDLTDFAKG